MVTSMDQDIISAVVLALRKDKYSDKMDRYFVDFKDQSSQKQSETETETHTQQSNAQCLEVDWCIPIAMILCRPCWLSPNFFFIISGPIYQVHGDRQLQLSGKFLPLGYVALKELDDEAPVEDLSSVESDTLLSKCHNLNGQGIILMTHDI